VVSGTTNGQKKDRQRLMFGTPAAPDLIRGCMLLGPKIFREEIKFGTLQNCRNFVSFGNHFRLRYLKSEENVSKIYMKSCGQKNGHGLNR
jgi:hypothetical protein